ncbi:MAG: hypothetical protein QNJ03_06045 [Dinoroseobacter sp.]|nr:hypothetical protein [Dinoroseobacter sp.]
MLRHLSVSFLVALCGAAPALAHPGHLEALAGHDHWVAGAAIGLAIALGLWGALKGKKDSEAEAEDEDASEEEAPA